MTRGSYEIFLNQFGWHQSRGNYNAVSQNNSLGKYHLHEEALVDIGMVTVDGDARNNDFSGGWTGTHGIHNKEEFLASPEAQDKAARDVMAKLADYLRDVLHYDGQVINGVEISVSVLLAAAYTVGTEKIERFLTSGGTYNPTDSDGRSLLDHLKESSKSFFGYEVPFAVDHGRRERFIGSQGDDRVKAFGGKDLFDAKGGSDDFDGGDGEDKILLDGNRGDYAVKRSTVGPTTWTIERGAECKTIRNVELIEFADGEVIDLRGAAASARAAVNDSGTDVPPSAPQAPATVVASDCQPTQPLPSAMARGQDQANGIPAAVNTAKPDGLVSCRFGGRPTEKVEKDWGTLHIGSDCADRVRGSDGKDVFVAKGGWDSFWGGGGEDTIVIDGNHSDYEWSKRYIKKITDRREIKTISDVERIEFKDGTVDLKNPSAVLEKTTATTTALNAPETQKCSYQPAAGAPAAGSADVEVLTVQPVGVQPTAGQDEAPLA